MRSLITFLIIVFTLGLGLGYTAAKVAAGSDVKKEVVAKAPSINVETSINLPEVTVYGTPAHLPKVAKADATRVTNDDFILSKGMKYDFEKYVNGKDSTSDLPKLNILPSNDKSSAFFNTSRLTPRAIVKDIFYADLNVVQTVTKQYTLQHVVYAGRSPGNNGYLNSNSYKT